MADNQDPLAALQQLLEDQKKQSGSGVASSAADGTGAEALTNEEEKPTGPTAEEIAVLQKNREAEDQIKIAEQLDRMKTELRETPQYQARASQKEANEASDAEKRLEERSKRIFQLKHLDS